MSVRIQFQRDGAAAPVDLAPGGRSSPESLELSARRLDEIAEYLRAAAVTPLERENLRHEFSFPVWREHATAAAAHLFMLDHPGAVCGVGLLSVEAEFSGAVARRWARASVRLARAEQEGVGTLHVYAVVCGAITREKPQ